VSPREGGAKTDSEPNRRSPRKKQCSSSNRNTRDSFSIDYYSIIGIYMGLIKELRLGIRGFIIIFL